MADYTGNAVKFKLGTQASLNTLKNSQKGWEVGTFYLTEDTSRLYIGQKDELALLNKSVEIYPNLEALRKKTTTSSEGDIAYCVTENVLAYYNGDTWNQINPDDDTILTALTQSVSSVTNGVKITTGGTNSDPKKAVTGADVTITGDKGVQVARTDSTALKITGDTYALNVQEHSGTTNDIDLVLDSALQNDSTVHIKGGDNVTITKTADSNGIQITAKDTKLNDISLGLGADGELQVGASDTGNTNLLKKQKLGYFIDGSYYGIGSNEAAKKVDLPVYSKDQVDNLIKKLDGMTYRGTIGTSGTTFTMDASFNVLQGGTPAEIHIGDMFLVQGGKLTYTTGKQAETGDMLIATAKKDKSETNGVLAIGDVDWTFIPSGDDSKIDTTYIFKASGADDSMTITSSTSNGAAVGKIAFTKGDGIVIESTDNGGNTPNQLSVNIKHDTYNTTKTPGNKTLTNGGTFDVIDSITYDNGHITGINTKTIQTLQYRPGPDSANMDAGGANSVTVKHTLLAGDNLVSDDNAKMVLKSDTLKLTASDGNTVTADLVWGSF